MRAGGAVHTGLMVNLHQQAVLGSRETVSCLLSVEGESAKVRLEKQLRAITVFLCVVCKRAVSNIYGRPAPRWVESSGKGPPIH